MPHAPTRPNILFFFSDQQRWDTCGCYGQALPVTPNLDRMAAEGVRFEHAYTCQPVCGPARACLQTGQYAAEAGCFRNNIALPLDAVTVPKLLSARGYEVGYVGKWHLASTGGLPDEPEVNHRDKPVPVEYRGGFKDFWVAADVLEFTSHSYDGHMFDADGTRREFPPGRYRADAVTDHVIDFLQSPGRGQDSPFYLMVSYIEPHHQNDHDCFEGPHGSKEKWADYEVPGDLVDTGGDWRENYPDYLGCCASLDENLGRIRDELDRLGLADNTVILFTSDHGSHFCTRNGEYKRSCHDGCIRIPMVASGPGFAGGKTASAMASLIDIPPTLLAAAGVEAHPQMRGRPLQEIATGQAPPDWPEEVFLQISESHVGRAIRTKRWKYSVRAPEKKGWQAPASDVYVEDFLYDLDADPHERNNLVADPAHAAIRAELAETLKRRMAQAGETVPEIRPAGE